MEMENIMLSRKDIGLIEDAIVRYGRIVTFGQLAQIFKKEYSRAETKNRVSLLSKKGWLARLKKGLYAVVTDIGLLSTNGASANAICQALNHDSYISFENALQYYGMFDQMLSSVSAVTFKRARRYAIKDLEVRYFKIQKRLYFGYKEERSDIGLVNIAEKEKSILDILYFRSNDYYISLVWEKLREHKSELNFETLKRYAKKYNLAVIRRVGFLLECLDINTDDLHKMVKGNTSYCRMTTKSRDFNAKWRVYFDRTIIK
jgi:Predicted transcriptional regulator